MDSPEAVQLAEELRHFKEEREKVRQVVGQIGGRVEMEREKIVTRIFIIALLALFVLDIANHVAGLSIALPPTFSLSIGILLVSVKIIWMIRGQSRVEHFQFWILNSIEYRVNEINKKLCQIENELAGEDVECDNDVAVATE